MTIDRQTLFTRLRALKPDGRFSADDVALIDAIADDLGLERRAPSSDAPTLTPSRAAAALIKSFEGCKLTAYPDPGSGGDPWTIGWGSTGPDIRKGTVWTQEQADARFAAHLAEFGEGVAKMLGGAPTTQQQFDAMVSLAYNIGLTNFDGSTVRRAHKAGDYAKAQAAFALWNKAAGKVMAGLTRRRAAEAAMYGSAA